MRKIVVCGAGGYIGSRLVKYLVKKGHEGIVAVYSRPAGDTPGPGVECLYGDLKQRIFATRAVKDASWVFNLAASVGGISFVTSNTSKCLSNVLINTLLLEESVLAGVERYFFSSSSCVYPEGIKVPLIESFAVPASPMGGYGWEKLFSELTCLAFAKEKNLPVSIARYHGIYGPGDVREAGRDHVATALAKKVIHAKRSGVLEIPIWGDGEQTRSFLFVDDCVEGTYQIMLKGVQGPVNLANPKPCSVNQLVSVLEEIAGVRLTRFYSSQMPEGVKHKVSDNTLLRESLNWEPDTAIISGMRTLYNDLWTKSMLEVW